MTVLKLVNTSGNALGMVSWFAVHNTSMGNDNHLVSADNKGYAAYLFEKDMHTDYSEKKTFAAAFAQSNCGDVSPNIYGGESGWGSNDFESTWYAGKKQYEAAKSLFDTAYTKLSNNLEYRHQFVDFSREQLLPEYADGQSGKGTYTAAIGLSFAGGAEDGPSFLYPTIHEGMTQDNSNMSDIMNELSSWYETIAYGNGDTELWKQHYPKPILSAIGMQNPPWTPEILPVQIFKLGQLAILGAPVEITTVAGRRLRARVSDTLKAIEPENHIVIAGLSNAYAGYVATKEEYDMQHYEGASTHFGPWTLNAFIQNFDELAKAMVDGTSAEAGPTPRDLSSSQISVQTGVWHDGVPIGKNFGDVETNANDYYGSGQTVNVKFWSGHPKNDLKLQSSYLAVQKYENGSWKTVLNDWDWDTKLRWERVDPVWGTSLTTVEWTISADTPSGLYRVQHYGKYKEAITGNIKAYTGTSRVFNVKASGAQSYIGNMDVTVTTSKDWWSGTNDNIYLGMKYTDGTKSEFLLDTDWVDDFEPGDKRTYKVFSMKKQSEVTEVYLRKSGIDHWKVQALKLTTGGEVKLDKTINQWIKTSSDSWKTSVSW